MHRLLLSLGLLGGSMLLAVDRTTAQTVVSDGTLNTIVNSANNRDFIITNGTSAAKISDDFENDSSSYRLEQCKTDTA